MKLTKADLKSLVKECLAEILSEGLGAGVVSKEQPRELLKHNQFESRKPSPRPIPTAHLKEAIKREAGGNKVMESILADTAASTLPKFLQNDGKMHQPSVGGGLAENVVAASTPEDLFGDDVTSKWASLAFMDSPTKK